MVVTVAASARSPSACRGCLFIKMKERAGPRKWITVSLAPAGIALPGVVDEMECDRLIESRVVDSRRDV